MTDQAMTTLRLYGDITFPGVARSIKVSKHSIHIESLKKAMENDEPVFLVNYFFDDINLDEINHDIGIIVKIRNIEQQEIDYKITLLGVNRARIEKYDEKNKMVLRYKVLDYDMDEAHLFNDMYNSLVARIKEYALFMNSLSMYRLYEKYSELYIENIDYTNEKIYLLNRITIDTLDEILTYPEEYHDYLMVDQIGENIKDVYTRLYKSMVEEYYKRYPTADHDDEISAPKISIDYVPEKPDLKTPEEPTETDELMENAEEEKATMFTKRTEEEVDEVQNLELKMIEKRMPNDKLEIVQKEMNLLRRESENSKSKLAGIEYLELVADLPWSYEREENDIKEAQKIMDTTHYGMEEAKNEIIKVLAERKLNKDAQGAVLCLAGPPGVGKTSLVRTIAEATNREFVQIKLGGVADEAIIRGFPRTYTGSLPGVLIQEMRRTNSVNPVILLDEIDKVGSKSNKGNVTAALLEVLDPSQNEEFRDYYLGIPYDLSKCLFVATANYLDQIPHALIDRMEVVQLPGYSSEEKLVIAQEYIIRPIIQDGWLSDYDIQIDEDAVMKLINRYSDEAGVRSIEKAILGMCREIAVRISLKNQHTFHITEDNIDEFTNISEEQTLEVAKQQIGFLINE